VALDPEGRDGMRVALELMLEPPMEMPPDLRDELERAQSDRIRAGIIPGLIVFAAMIVLALGLPAIAGARDWTIPLMVAGVMSIALATSARRLRMANLAVAWRGALITSACLCVAIGLSSTYLGPLTLAPQLAVAVATALVASQLRWRMTLALAASAIVVPFVLEWTHVIPANYQFSADTITVTSHVMELPEDPIRISILITTLVALVGSVRYVRRVVKFENDLRQRFLLQNWHLRQMARVD
jgi:hypothetical protein